VRRANRPLPAPAGVSCREREYLLKRFFFFTTLLTLGLALGCKAQPAAPLTDQMLNHRIEVMIRSQFNIPANYTITLGARTPSQLPGYQTLPVSISTGSTATVVDFLLSADNKTLARLEKYDLVNDPLFSINVAGRPIRGNPDAKVTVISFDDLECPFCARMHQTLFPATLEHYKDKVRFIYKDWPLLERHPWAMRAAIDSDCLAAQSGDVYWQYVDYIHEHGDEVNGNSQNLAKSFDALDRIARQQGTLGKLDSVRLDACLLRQDDSQVRASMKDGDALHVNGVPALFIDGEFINGAVPQSQVWSAIDRALRAAGEVPPPQTATPQAKVFPPQAQPAAQP
jgi:protein-disulfide isomerase